MINRLFDAMLAGQGREVIGKILDGLVTYTSVHFKREEDLFAKTGYSGAASHKALHAGLIKQVLAVQEKYKSGATAALSLEVMNFLKSWLVNHIQGTDKEYTPFLNSKGIT